MNPESLALFARANLDMISTGRDGPFKHTAGKCLDWLLEHDSSHKGNFHGRCWGYQHPWQSPGFYQPPGSPNCYITVIAADALLHGYYILKNEDYLRAAREAAEFILHDLSVLYEKRDEKCISYVPGMKTDFAVININALAAAFLAEVGMATGERNLLHQAEKLMAFVARRQTDYGAWHYTTDPRQSLVAHDNYHTGMILDALMTYRETTGDLHFHGAFNKGLVFYREQLFLPDGAPKWSSQRTLPHDIHGSAQGILTFSLSGDEQMALRVAQWAISHFYKGNGDFAYQIGRFFHKRFTLLHWCNGWMVRGLASLVQTMHTKYGDRSHGNGK